MRNVQRGMLYEMPQEKLRRALPGIRGTHLQGFKAISYKVN